MLQEAETLLSFFLQVDCFATKPYLPATANNYNMDLQEIKQEGMTSIELIKRKISNIKRIIDRAESKYIWFTFGKPRVFFNNDLSLR